MTTMRGSVRDRSRDRISNCRDTSTPPPEQLQQWGGVVLGQGGFGTVRTLDELDKEDVYVLDYVNLRTGKFESRVFDYEKLMRLFGHRVVYKENFKTKEQETNQRLHSLGQFRQFHERRRRFLADFMMRWADTVEGVQESAKWEFLSDILRKGIRAPEVQHLMPLYRFRDYVYLCLRPQKTLKLFPLYRYMHGDLRTMLRYYIFTVRDLVSVIDAVIKCLTALQIFGGIHHCDIKPENILFRVRGIRPLAPPPVPKSEESVMAHAAMASLVASRKKKVEYVMSDFDSAVNRPGARHLLHVRGTPGFMSPLCYRSFDDFKDKYDKFADRWANFTSRTTAENIWASYAEIIRARDAVLQGQAPEESFDSDAVFVKNDLYAIGITVFSYFPLPQFFEHLAERLVMGGTTDFWKIVELENELEAIAQRLKHQDGVAKIHLYETKRRFNQPLPVPVDNNGIVPRHPPNNVPHPLPHPLPHPHNLHYPPRIPAPQRLFKSTATKT